MHQGGGIEEGDLLAPSKPSMGNLPQIFVVQGKKRV